MRELPDMKLPYDQIAAVAIGGAIGSVSRFLCGHLLGNWLGTLFPWGTLMVNILGSIWLGYIATISLQRPGSLDPTLRLLLTTGFAGGFTTFSSFAYETLALLQQNEPELAVANIGSNMILGFIACWLGFVIARMQG